MLFVDYLVTMLYLYVQSVHFYHDISRVCVSCPLGNFRFQYIYIYISSDDDIWYLFSIWVVIMHCFLKNHSSCCAKSISWKICIRCLTRWMKIMPYLFAHISTGFFTLFMKPCLMLICLCHERIAVLSDRNFNFISIFLYLI